MHFFRKNLPLLLKSYFILALLIISALVGLTCFSGYFNVNFDEILYLNYGRMFSEANSLKTPFTANELSSPAGGFGWYGPFYNIIYGCVFKVLGASHNSMVVFHYILFLLCFLVIKYLPLSTLKRWIFACVFISSYIAGPFVLTAYPETIHLFLSLVLVLVYSKLNDSKKLFFLYLFLIFFFSLIRITFIFWVFSILFLKDIRISLWIRFTICIAFVLGILVYARLCNTPSSVQGLSEVYYAKADSIFTSLKNILNNFKTNVYMLYNQSSGSVMLFLVLIGIAAFNLLTLNKKEAFRSKNTGLMLVIVMTTSVFLFFYLSEFYYLEKQTGFLIPLLIYIIISTRKNILLLLVLSLIVFLPYSMIRSVNNFQERKNSYYDVEKDADLYKEMSHIFDGVRVNAEEEICVLHFEPDFDVIENYLYAYMPLEHSGNPIIYTCLAYNKSKPNEFNKTAIPLEKKFATFGRYKINYVLSRYPLNFPNIKCVKTNKYYYLYYCPGFHL